MESNEIAAQVKRVSTKWFFCLFSLSLLIPRMGHQLFLVTIILSLKSTALLRRILIPLKTTFASGKTRESRESRDTRFVFPEGRK